MPKTLLDRCQPDSIREFRHAAEERFQDGIVLATAGRRTAAIYLWGYAVEMTLKAAYFETSHFLIDQVITLQDLQQAMATAVQLGIHWPGNLHRTDAWAQFITSMRSAVPAQNYRVPGFGSRVLAHALTVAQYWRETLRYRKNVAYWYEVERVWTSTEWLLEHSADR